MCAVSYCRKKTFLFSMRLKKQTQEALERKMTTLQIFEEDLVEKFILGSGKGGQKVNKTHSCVYLKHIPSGIEIKCQKERSRTLNRYLARKMLCEKIEEKENLLEREKKKKIAKIRKQKKRRSKKTKEKLFELKKILSQKKELRKTPKEES